MYKDEGEDEAYELHQQQLKIRQSEANHLTELEEEEDFEEYQEEKNEISDIYIPEIDTVPSDLVLLYTPPYHISETMMFVFSNIFPILIDPEIDIDSLEILDELVEVIVDFPYIIPPALFLNAAYKYLTTYDNIFLEKLFFIFIDVDDDISLLIASYLEEHIEDITDINYAKFIFYILDQTQTNILSLENVITEIYGYCVNTEEENLNFYIYKIIFKTYTIYHDYFDFSSYFSKTEYNSNSYKFLTWLLIGQHFEFTDINMLISIAIYLNAGDFKSKESATILMYQFFFTKTIEDLDCMFDENADSMKCLLDHMIDIDLISMKELYNYFKENEKLLSLFDDIEIEFDD